jgi:hypothetical protein
VGRTSDCAWHGDETRELEISCDGVAGPWCGGEEGGRWREEGEQLDEGPVGRNLEQASRDAMSLGRWIDGIIIYSRVWW